MGSTRTITLIGASGTRHVLACSAEPYQLGMGAQLWGSTPYNITSRRLGVIPGETINQIRPGVRSIVVPIQVEGATELEIDERLAALGSILSPRSEIRIIYKRADGTERELTGTVVGGTDAIQAVDRSGHLQRHVRVPVVVRAFFPYWRSTSAGIEVTGPTTFDNAGTGGSNLVDVVNVGDVDCWPDFTITGYADAVEMMNLTTGQVWRISEIIAIGDTLRVDTDPRTRSVIINDDWAWPAVDPISEFWPLRPGLNRLLFRSRTSVAPSFTPATPAGAFTMRWRPLYETC